MFSIVQHQQHGVVGGPSPAAASFLAAQSERRGWSQVRRRLYDRTRRGDESEFVQRSDQQGQDDKQRVQRVERPGTEAAVTAGHRNSNQLTTSGITLLERLMQLNDTVCIGSAHSATRKAFK